ncbi:hypothetical protein [Streptomyces sp.]|uniref:hypothetical protein n=1 Tax=Streptomyces sp. TaxID=1931 RepID=UPI002F957149
MADLLMLVPSRGRPSAVAELAHAWAATSKGAADLLVVVDDDDPELPRYRDLGVNLRVHVSSGSRGIVPVLNAAAVEAAGRHRMVGFMGDDHRPRTAGWDKRIVDQLNQLKTGIVYGDDLLRGEALPTAVAMTSDIIRALGYMAPPALKHLFVDNVWYDLGHALDRIRYLPDVTIEHLHPAIGKGQWDDLYRELNAESTYGQDRDAYDAYNASGEFSADVDKVRQFAKAAADA